MSKRAPTQFCCAILKSFLLVTLLATSLTALGQGEALTVKVKEKQPPIPKTTGVVGEIDPAAWTEIVNHRKAVGNYIWTGLQGTGQVVFGKEDSSPANATFSILGSDEFRLDIQTSAGLRSTRISGLVGGEQAPSDGKTSVMSPETASFGIFPFVIPRTIRKTGGKYSLRDDGMELAVDGIQLHRVTLEWSSVGINPSTKKTNTQAMDLYFDASSHMLVKTVFEALVPRARRVKFTFVTTYSDYRKVGEVLIPYRMAETMQGRPYRTLQLSEVTLYPQIPDSFFTF